MDGNELADLLLESATLKRMPRSGWAMHGVPHVESVAEHGFGVAFVTLALVDTLDASDEPDGAEKLDLEKALVIALLHDLAEVRLTDLPVSATRLISGAVKLQAEAAAMSDLLAPLPGARRLDGLWQEYVGGSSAEGRLVRDADKLEMMVQCLRYEQAGSRGLDDFWKAMDQRQWHYRLCADLYAHLKTMRPSEDTHPV